MSKTANETVESEETLDEDTRRYEIMAIIDPDVPQAEYKKHFEALKELIQTHGGSISHEEEWGKRELAYTVKKRDHGYYVVINFDGIPAQIPEINAQLRITGHILRYLIIIVPDNYTPQTYDLDAVIEEAQPEDEPEMVVRKAVAPKPGPNPEPKVEKVEKLKVVEEVVEEPTPEPEVEKDEEPEVAEEEVAEVEEVVKAPVKEKPAAEKLSELDEKLEKLLNEDDDLNL
ncbi:MAG: 30S ribosomal protein S6 [Candidatus Peregrinibacteria bacterium]|nr:30S ribosomal protein S6 [Candidatus Peregrinibacteria bacterium]